MTNERLIVGVEIVPNRLRFDLVNRGRPHTIDEIIEEGAFTAVASGGALLSGFVAGYALSIGEPSFAATGLSCGTILISAQLGGAIFSIRRS